MSNESNYPTGVDDFASQNPKADKFQQVTDETFTADGTSIRTPNFRILKRDPAVSVLTNVSDSVVCTEIFTDAVLGTNEFRIDYKDITTPIETDPSSNGKDFKISYQAFGTPVNKDQLDILEDALIKIQNELGLDPSSAEFNTVKIYLDTIRDRMKTAMSVVGGTDTELLTSKAIYDFVIQYTAGMDLLPAVISKDILTTPGSPISGDRYFIDGVGTGAWATHDNEIAQWNGSSWDYTSMSSGMYFKVKDLSAYFIWDGDSLESFDLLSKFTDLTDGNLIQGSGTDGYAITWDNTAGKFVLTEVSPPTQIKKFDLTGVVAGVEIEIPHGLNSDQYMLHAHNLTGINEELPEMVVTEKTLTACKVKFLNNFSSVRVLVMGGDAFTSGAFLDLLDTPTNYTGHGAKVLVVKVGEDGIEYLDADLVGRTEFKNLNDTPEKYVGKGTPLIINEDGDGVAFGIPPNYIVDDDNALTLTTQFIHTYVSMTKIATNRVVILDGNNTLIAYEYTNGSWLKIGNSYTNLPESGSDYQRHDIVAFDSLNIYVMEEHLYSPYFTVIKKYSFDGTDFTLLGSTTFDDYLTGNICVVSANKILLHHHYIPVGIQLRTSVLEFNAGSFNVLNFNDDGNLNTVAGGSMVLGKAHRFSDNVHFAYIFTTTQNDRHPEIHTMLFNDTNNTWSKVSVNHIELPKGIPGNDYNIPSILIDDRTIVIIDRVGLKFITYSWDFVSKKWSLNNESKDLGAGFIQNKSALAEIQGKLTVARTNATQSFLETMSIEDSKVYISKLTELLDCPSELIADKYLQVDSTGKKVSLVDLPEAEIQIPYRNYIDNGQFDFFQRGNSYTFQNTQQNIPDPAWVSDRWWTFLGLTSGGVAVGDNTITKETFTTLPAEINEGSPRNFLKISTVCTGSNQTYAIPIVQPIEDVRTLNGKDANLSLFIRASGDGSINTSITIYQVFDSAEPDLLVTSQLITTVNDNIFRKYSINMSLPTVTGKVIGANSHLKVSIYSRNGSNPFAGSFINEYTNIQLVEGSIALPYTAENQDSILRRCQRYYEKSDGFAVATKCNMADTNFWEFYRTFKVTKRVVPTVVFMNRNNNNAVGFFNMANGVHTTYSGFNYQGVDATGYPAGLLPVVSQFTSMEAIWTAEAEFY